MDTDLSIIVPCYNEAAGITEFHRRLSMVLNVLPETWQVVYVNDGSKDKTFQLLSELSNRDGHVAVLNLSRNFGKEIALTAGLDYSRGKLVVVIDADLQDPPELIPELISVSKQGWDIVFAQRRLRYGETWVKRTTATMFYNIMSRLGDVRIPPNTGDFRLMSRRAVDAMSTMRERHRFMKGLFTWVGFPSTAVVYDRDSRFAGGTSWNYWKLWNFALEGITSHTVAPLKISTYAGFLVSISSIFYGFFLVGRTLFFGTRVPGYPSLMAVILFLGGVQLFTIDLLGEYLGRIFNEAKQRPLYFVERFVESDVQMPCEALTALGVAR